MVLLRVVQVVVEPVDVRSGDPEGVRSLHDSGRLSRQTLSLSIPEGSPPRVSYEVEDTGRTYTTIQ